MLRNLGNPCFVMVHHLCISLLEVCSLCHNPSGQCSSHLFVQIILYSVESQTIALTMLLIDYSLTAIFWSRIFSHQSDTISYDRKPLPYGLQLSQMSGFTPLLSQPLSVIYQKNCRNQHFMLMSFLGHQV